MGYSLKKKKILGKNKSLLCLFGFIRPIREIFTHSTITSERLHILIYAGYLWSLSYEGSLACHIYCDTWRPFIMVISDGPWYSHLLQSVYQWICHHLFKRLKSVLVGVRTLNLFILLDLLKLNTKCSRQG